ncbi:hypothetical protein TRIP_C20465 [Candidatus Zixiibacteriota bacterium]|nr:hypothetical protein TRIP_C20465 [candidate division Zixibacteria bacterium]
MIHGKKRTQIRRINFRKYLYPAIIDIINFLELEQKSGKEEP